VPSVSPVQMPLLTHNLLELRESENNNLPNFESPVKKTEFSKSDLHTSELLTKLQESEKRLDGYRSTVLNAIKGSLLSLLKYIFLYYFIFLKFEDLTGDPQSSAEQIPNCADVTLLEKYLEFYLFVIFFFYDFICI
jgi:hypothetical protein